jgi:uncharacterized protein
MKSVKSLADKYPISAFLLLCFTMTWTVWLSVPAIAGTDWALGKIIVGAGFGPALAAIILAQLNGTGCKITLRWWGCFAVVFTLMVCIYCSILMTGDAITATAFQTAVPVGFSFTSVLSVILSSAMAAFIVSSLVCSRDPRLNSILSWRVPLRYWLVALFLPASWMLLGLLSAHLMDSPIPLSIDGDAPELSNELFLLRSLLFTFLVVAIGEEAGWRGWLLPALQRRFSPLMSSFLLGLVWGAWHFPLFVIGQYAESPVATFAKMGACVMLATMFTWLYNRASHNLLLAVVLHTAFNNTPRLLPQTEQMAMFLMAILASMIIYDKMWRPIPYPNLTLHHAKERTPC